MACKQLATHIWPSFACRPLLFGTLLGVITQPRLRLVVA